LSNGRFGRFSGDAGRNFINLPRMNRTCWKSLLALVAAAVFASACSFSPLQERVLSSNPKVRLRALKRVRGLVPDERDKLVNAMIGALGNADGRIANRAAETLTVVGEPAVEPVLQVLESPDPFLRVVGISVLADIAAQPDDVVPALTARLSDPHPLVREEAAHGLSAFGTRAASAEAALRAATRDPEPAVQEAATQALRRVVPAPSPTPRTSS
jgi:hypothetical protein